MGRTCYETSHFLILKINVSPQAKSSGKLNQNIIY